MIELKELKTKQEMLDQLEALSYTHTGDVFQGSG
jgi:hypothetical protein